MSDKNKKIVQLPSAREALERENYMLRSAMMEAHQLIVCAGAYRWAAKILMRSLIETQKSRRRPMTKAEKEMFGYGESQE